MVAACPAPARPGIGRDRRRDRRLARVGVVGPKQVRNTSGVLRPDWAVGVGQPQELINQQPLDKY
jgi:hypothetical protein